MSLTDEINAKEAQIAKLSDPRWDYLANARRSNVNKEKDAAQGKPYSAEVCQSIDQGYLNMLDCILSIAEK
jgi:hypothetical protein